LHVSFTDTSSSDSLVQSPKKSPLHVPFINFLHPDKQYALRKPEQFYLVCFLWLKYLIILLAEFVLLSATYFAQNSASKFIKA